MREVFETDFAVPLREYIKKSHDKEKDICIDCENLISGKEKVSIAFMKDMADDLSRKRSAFWNCKVDAFLCPVCAYIYALAPLGFLIIGRRYVFVNVSSDIDNLLAANNKYGHESIESQKDTEKEERYSSWIARTINILLGINTKGLSNVQVITRGINDTDTYTFDVISKNVLQASTATKGGGRISQETAKAILAKTYLSAAWDLNKQDYFSKAAALADEVIAGRRLTTPYAKLWKADGSGDDNEEFLWDVEYDLATANNTTSGGTEWSGYYCNYLGGNEDNIKATTSSYVPTLYALHCFKKGDQRYDATFMKELPDINKGNAAGTGYWTWYKNGESLVGKPVTRYYSAWYETDADFEAWKEKDPANRANTYRIPMDSQTKESQNMDGKDMDYYDNQLLVYGSSPCKKFDDSQTASNQKNTCYRDIHIITLPEMYLVAAEAYLKAGDNTKALARLNEVHQRAGLAALTGAITIDNILDESACENFGNCARWMDLRRTKTLVERCTKYNYEMGDKAAQYIGEKLLRPIPQAAIDANDQLSSADQNPGY